MIFARMAVALGLIVAVASRAPAAAEPYVLKRAEQEYTQNVTDSPCTYRVEMGGTLDGFNTVFYRADSGYLQESKFEPNEYLVLENVGSVDVVNPRIVINGRRNWHSAAEILAGILKPGMTDAEKAMAIYMFTASFDVQSHNNARTVGSGWPWAKDSHPSATLGEFQERANPVKAVNLYYCGGCSYAAANFAILCRRAGLPARTGWLGDYVEGDYRRGGAHCMPEVWYDGAWHLFDSDGREFYLEADNRTVASWETLSKNPDLVARTHDGGFPSPPEWVGGYAKLFSEQPFATQMPIDQWLTTMDVTLRPDEKFIWRWDHIGKWRYNNKSENKPHWAPFHLGNGKIIYRPKLAGKLLWGGVLGMQNVKSVGDDPSGGQVQPILAGPPGYVTYKVSSPYPIVGGVVGAKFQRKTAQDHCRILISVRADDFREIWSAAHNAREMQPCVAIDEVLSAKWSPAIYCYYVKLELQAATAPEDVLLEEVYLETDVQMATTANPALSVGVNEVVYRDQSPPGRQVRITHGWKESSDTRPPLAPAGPVVPAEGAVIDLATLKTLTWHASEDPEGQPIADYHVQVSPREDMLHPVSTNLDRLTFSGKPEWALPEGWLNKGNTYYWRVRARDQWGAWSGWSRVWKFHINEK